jgi:hypothetical protein
MTRKIRASLTRTFFVQISFDFISPSLMIRMLLSFWSREDIFHVEFQEDKGRISMTFLYLLVFEEPLAQNNPYAMFWNLPSFTDQYTFSSGS